MKTAVIHDWLVTYAGADRVLEQVLACFPDADLYSLVDFLPAQQRGFIQNKPVQTSFFQHLPFARQAFRKYLPLMPLAIEQFDLSAYDLVISSSHAIAKGVITGPDQLHICLCYTPMRYAWDLQHQYLEESGLDKGWLSWPTRWMLQRLRLWDATSANRVDEFIAISRHIAHRILKVYRRESTVIYPPVNVDAFVVKPAKEDFYLTVSRLVHYKRVGLIIDAFRSMPDRKFVIIGDGPQLKNLRQAAGNNVAVLGFQPWEVVHEHMQRARGFVFAAEEDFGISMLEAQACGTPVIAFGKGGALETISGLDSDEPTGVFFQEQSAASIVEAISIFERHQDRFSAWACRKNAARFSVARFRSDFKRFCDDAMERSRAKWEPQQVANILSDVSVGI